MIFIAAVLALIGGVVLGTLLIASLIQVLGWGVFTLALVPLLPLGLDLVAQMALAVPGLVGNAFALTIIALAILLVSVTWNGETPGATTSSPLKLGSAPTFLECALHRT